MAHRMRRLAPFAAAGGLLLSAAWGAGPASAGDDADFADFTPLAASAGPAADEAFPITLGNPDMAQRTVVERNAQLAAGVPNSGNFDMLTLNETGRNKGKFLFSVFETDQGGVQRTNLKTGKTETLWMSPASGGHVAFDASYWTPWGTFITAEEAWCTDAAGCNSTYGRLFELRNPLSAPGITGPISEAANAGADFVHRNVVPRTSHEGIQFDSAGNMYFIDELNGGAIYRYTPAARMSKVLDGKADYFAAGQTSVLRVGDGSVANATGAYAWVPITDAMGAPLPGAISITDANGVTSVDPRNTTDLPAFKATDYQRPEDLQISKEKGREVLYVATTTTNEVYRLDLKARTISVYANRATVDLATGAAVDAGLTSPDNLAVDHDGNIYIVEDRNGAVDDDIWMAKDRNNDGDLLDAGEGIGRWASNGTVGSEFSGLYFDPFNEHRAWVNIQHPASANDRTMELTVDGEHHHH